MCQHAMRSCGRGAEGMAGAFRKVNSVLQATNIRVYKEQELGINRRKVLLLENSRGCEADKSVQGPVEERKTTHYCVARDGTF